jgi:hypothetical protein
MYHYYALARIAQDRVDDLTRAAARRAEHERFGQARPAARGRRRWRR